MMINIQASNFFGEKKKRNVETVNGLCSGNYKSIQASARYGIQKKIDVIISQKDGVLLPSKGPDRYQLSFYLLFQESSLHLCVSHSVMSDSLGPHALQPTNLLCPWNSPGKNTGVGWHSLLQGPETQVFLTAGRFFTV